MTSVPPDRVAAPFASLPAHDASNGATSIASIVLLISMSSLRRAQSPTKRSGLRGSDEIARGEPAAECAGYELERIRAHVHDVVRLTGADRGEQMEKNRSASDGNSVGDEFRRKKAAQLFREQKNEHDSAERSDDCRPSYRERRGRIGQGAP